MSIGYALNEIGRDWATSDCLFCDLAVFDSKNNKELWEIFCSLLLLARSIFLKSLRTWARYVPWLCPEWNWEQLGEFWSTYSDFRSGEGELRCSRGSSSTVFCFRFGPMTCFIDGKHPIQSRINSHNVYEQRNNAEQILDFAVCISSGFLSALLARWQKSTEAFYHKKTLSESREWELFKKSGIIKIGSRSSENHWKQDSGQEFEHFDGFLYRKADLKA